MPTLKDVAREANVSVSTASYAINGSTLISKETREKVIQAAQKIGYRPNANAKNLKKNKSEVIGFFLSGFTGPFFNEILEGVQDVVIKNGYEMVVCASDQKHRLLVESYVDGAIILNFHLGDQIIEDLANEKLPIVTLDREIENKFIKNVILQNKVGMDLAVNHLVNKGHKRIGFIGGHTNSYDGEKRLEGFRESLSAKNLPFRESDLIRANFTEISGLLAMELFIELNKNDMPTAFVSANDEMAMGAIKALQQNGFHVPNDVAVVGFDDIALSKYADPPLSTVRIQKKLWGEIAANTLFKMLDKQYEDEIPEVPIEFIQRSSS
ncbi:LacI family DNA-binding transcriptional regulator [Sutcliffiella sp. NC1]|uniref:LacI family DNA-binding transcriptional regulator n=1 Tax=Sutcliffiella sp. NC1 TaxID=3004096 RepID=UPI0022DD3B2C|nr:LacI family DNA-binding transcriptional regulator [Sutcliffiella sp. NC1]WBL14665.1 LacI family DNA-binding transcriptional regulator [Sutcliffiella sp. NC1]